LVNGFFVMWLYGSPSIPTTRALPLFDQAVQGLPLMFFPLDTLHPQKFFSDFSSAGVAHDLPHRSPYVLVRVKIFSCSGGFGNFFFPICWFGRKKLPVQARLVLPPLIRGFP